MPRRQGLRGAFVIAASLWTAANGKAAEPPVDFHRAIRPLLVEKCAACHGGGERAIEGEFDLTTAEGLLRGGESGLPGIVPGKPDESSVVAAIAWKDPALRMPPKENDRLSAEQVALVRRWISEGAKIGPPPTALPAEPVAARPGEPERVRFAQPGGRSQDWDDRTYAPDEVWAWQPIRRVEVPAVRLDGKPVVHPIDAFLLAAIRKRGLPDEALSPPAAKHELIRRLSFGLLGLPPTPEEVREFERDDSDGAFAAVLERYLASPHHGERLAQHWLDVVRFADTNGFANDFERPHAWRYRDYVVRSFQADKPFDRFVLEQIAGDELFPDDPEMRIAVGFLRSGPWEHTGMSVAAVTRQQFLDDVTHAVGATFLGQGLRCAACHDHKFDPVPTRDYYRLQACFATTFFAEPKVDFLPTENVAGFEADRAPIHLRLTAAREAHAVLERKSKAAVAALLREKGVNKVDELPKDVRPNVGFFGLTDHEKSTKRIIKKRIEYFERELLRFEPHAFSVYSGPDNRYVSYTAIHAAAAPRADWTPPTTFILPGGAIETPADPVLPGVLGAVYGSNDRLAPSRWNTVPTAVNGRRAALARWVADPHNTLTARVIVNRVWQWHFGKGLVETSSNFGKMGKRPTHPELLDWLAGRFIDDGWSLRKLQRLILTSAAYRRGTDPAQTEKLAEVDARNESLCFFPPRRLSAEEIRDSLTAISGELNRTLGGPATYPEIHWEVALQPRHVMGSVAPAYLPSPRRSQRHRRTLYAFRYRTLADPFLEVFNRPGSEMSCERRDETTVAPQVLALFNGESTLRRAIAAALDLEKSQPNPERRIDEIFRRCLARTPTPDERDRCLRHLTDLTRLHADRPPTPRKPPTAVRRTMVEEMTGEEFSWDEVLEGMDRFEADVAPWEVSAETRALADVCLVLFNSNEFLSVR